MINDIDINKILVSKRESYGKENSFKYFIGYDDKDDIKPLHIMLPQITGSLNNLKIIIRQCLLKSLIKNCWKNSTPKWGKKLAV